MKLKTMIITLIILLIGMNTTFGTVNTLNDINIRKYDFYNEKYTYYYPTVVKYTPKPREILKTSQCKFTDTWKVTKADDTYQTYIANTNNQHIQNLAMSVEKIQPKSGLSFFSQYYDELYKKGYRPKEEYHKVYDPKCYYYPWGNSCAPDHTLDNITVKNGALYYSYFHKEYDREYHTETIEGLICKGDVTYRVQITETYDYYQPLIRPVYEMVIDSFKIYSN